MRCLADLARGFILPFFMGVAQGLRTEDDKQNCQGKHQQSDPGILRFVLGVHFDTYTTPVVRSTLRGYPGEQLRVLQSLATKAPNYCTPG